MAITPVDLNAYDIAATKIAYCKLFDHIMADFLTRKDCIEMMNPSNLPVNTNVTTAVQVNIVSGTGTGQGVGKGQCTPTYLGETPKGGSQALSQQRKAEKEAGGKAVTEGLNKALGG